MTYGNYILMLRRRLQDLRTSSGAIITTPATDGIRWSASVLEDIANSAFITLARLITFYPNSALSQIPHKAGYIQKRSISVPAAGLDITTVDSNLINIIHVLVESTNLEVPYVNPEDMSVYSYDATAQPRSGQYHYTILKDNATSKSLLLLLPAPSGALTCTLTYIYAQIYSLSTDTNKELNINGINDILLDIAELEAREYEHNWDRANMLFEKIMFKFGLSQQRGRE